MEVNEPEVVLTVQIHTPERRLDSKVVNYAKMPAFHVSIHFLVFYFYIYFSIIIVVDKLLLYVWILYVWVGLISSRTVTLIHNLTLNYKYYLINEKEKKKKSNRTHFVNKVYWSKVLWFLTYMHLKDLIENYN